MKSFLVFSFCITSLIWAGDSSEISEPIQNLRWPMQFKMDISVYSSDKSFDFQSPLGTLYYKFTEDTALMKAEFPGFCPPLPGAPQDDTDYYCAYYLIGYPNGQGGFYYTTYYVTRKPENNTLVTSCCILMEDIGAPMPDFPIRNYQAQWDTSLATENPDQLQSPIKPYVEWLHARPIENFLSSNMDYLLKNFDIDKSVVPITGTYYGAHLTPTLHEGKKYRAPAAISGIVPHFPPSGALKPAKLNLVGQMVYENFQILPLDNNIFDLPSACDQCVTLNQKTPDQETATQIKENCSCFGDGVVQSPPPNTGGAGCTTCHATSNRWSKELKLYLQAPPPQKD